MTFNIGETYIPAIYIEGLSTGPTFSMVRLSDGKIWDFENELWTLTPEDEFSEVMTPSDTFTNLYFGELDTSMFTEETEILFIYTSSESVITERVQFIMDRSLDVFASVVFNRTTEQTTLTCIGKSKQETILTPARVTFSILSSAGAVVVSPMVVTTSVNGVVTKTTADFEPVEGTGYILDVIYEYNGQSYNFSFPFAVV